LDDWWNEVIILNKTQIHLDNMLYYILLYIMSYTHTGCKTCSVSSHRLQRQLSVSSETHIHEKLHFQQI
jgi:hypothetical protein